MTVSQRFDQFLANLQLTAVQRQDGVDHHGAVRSCLNRRYYGFSSATSNSRLVGSWGKSTEVRPPRDVDVLFALPSADYERYQLKPGNKQSQLLQEVRNVLLNEYPKTDVRGDGPVVLVPFSTYAIELVPAFALSNGTYWICITKNGGSYKVFDPAAEINKVQQSNSDSKGNTRDLIRMLKRWQEYCNVPMKSFWLELLAIDFLSSWTYRGHSSVYYDWMIRDFFEFLVGKANTYLFVPGTYELLIIGSDWKSRAETARDRAKNATEHEAAGRPYSAGSEWRKIFGDDVPTG